MSLTSGGEGEEDEAGRNDGSVAVINSPSTYVDRKFLASSFSSSSSLFSCL